MPVQAGVKNGPYNYSLYKNWPYTAFWEGVGDIPPPCKNCMRGYFPEDWNWDDYLAQGGNAAFVEHQVEGAGPGVDPPLVPPKPTAPTVPPPITPPATPPAQPPVSSGAWPTIIKDCDLPYKGGYAAVGDTGFNGPNGFQPSVCSSAYVAKFKLEPNRRTVNVIGYANTTDSCDIEIAISDQKLDSGFPTYNSAQGLKVRVAGGNSFYILPQPGPDFPKEAQLYFYLRFNGANSILVSVS